MRNQHEFCRSLVLSLFVMIVFVIGSVLPEAGAQQRRQRVGDKAADGVNSLNWVDLYEPYADDEMPYRLMKPLDFDLNMRYPVIVSLHGGGGRGTDNRKQLKGWNRLLAEEQRRMDYPCYVLAPQSSRLWDGTHLKKIKDVIASLPSVDMDRIYILGHSMGGHGTYILIQLDSGYFAAAAPSAGSGLQRTGEFIDASLIKDIPIWAFHGDEDKVCPIERDEKLFAEMKELGGNMKLTTWVGDGHGIAEKMITGGDNGRTQLSSIRCDGEPDFMNWLFSHKRKVLQNSGQRKLPNVVMLLADDLGFKDIGCYDGPVKTPTLDRLASAGTRFSDFYSGCAVCSPSRATLLTGRHHIRAGVYSWIHDESQRSHLLEREVTLAEILKEAGYATAHVGKWHLGLPTDKYDKPTPDRHGFDYWFATWNNALPSHRNPDNFIRNGEPVGKLEGYSCQLVVDEAIGWLEKRRNKEVPFFLNVWFHEPHAPIAAPGEIVTEYGKAKDRAAIYSGTIDNTDRAIERLLKKLHEIAPPEDTLIIYASDNGSYRDDRTGNLRGRKGMNWEGGIRVPGIFYWPGRIKTDAVSGEPAGVVDILPTVCGLLGVDKPKGVHLDGSDLSGILLGKGETFNRHQPLYWHLQKSRPIVAIREGDYSLVADPDYEMSTSNMFKEEWIPAIKAGSYKNYQLFNLKNDPGQKNDISTDQPELLKRLKKELLEINASVMADGADWHEQEKVSSLPIKVFILAGQSNMEGFGRIGNDADVKGTLGWVAGNQSLKEELPILTDGNNNWIIRDSNGKWSERKDVWVYYDRLFDNKNIQNHKVLTGGLTVSYGFTDNVIGPEFGFGHVMGEFYKERVLIIKTCWGGRSLYNDFLPPSAEEYATPVKNGDKGFMYKRILDDAETVLGNIEKYFPDYNDEGFEIAGFCWHQGWNDGQSVTVAKQYESNMITFINDIREDLHIEFGCDPDLPFVIASSGFNGFVAVSDTWQKTLQNYVAPGQLAAAEKTMNCVGVDTRAFYRKAAESPGDAVYHWNFNAESYLRIGYGMGEAMKKLLAAEVGREATKPVL